MNEPRPERTSGVAEPLEARLRAEARMPDPGPAFTAAVMRRIEEDTGADAEVVGRIGVRTNEPAPAGGRRLGLALLAAAVTLLATGIAARLVLRSPAPRTLEPIVVSFDAQRFPALRTRDRAPDTPPAIEDPLELEARNVLDDARAAAKHVFGSWATKAVRFEVRGGS